MNLFTGLISSNTQRIPLQDHNSHLCFQAHTTEKEHLGLTRFLYIDANFYLPFTAQPGTANKFADFFHYDTTGKKLLYLKLCATCLAQHQNETWMNGLTKTLKDFHVPFCLPPHKGGAHLHKSHCSRTHVMKITTLLSCSRSCLHKFIARWIAVYIQ